MIGIVILSLPKDLLLHSSFYFILHSSFKSLFRNGNDERGERHDGADHGEPDGGAAADGRGAGLGLVGRDVEDVVLLEVVVGRVDDVAVVEVERDDLLLARAALPDEPDVVADAIDGHVARHGEGFEDVDLLVGDGERAGTGHFAQDGYLVVDHADGDDGRRVELGTEPLADELLGLALGESAQTDSAQHGEIDTAGVVHQVLLENGLGGQVSIVVADDIRHREVERLGQLGRLGAADHDGEQVLGLDAGIVEAVCRGYDGAEVLQVGDFLVAPAGGQEEGCENQQAECLKK